MSPPLALATPLLLLFTGLASGPPRTHAIAAQQSAEEDRGGEAPEPGPAAVPVLLEGGTVHAPEGVLEGASILIEGGRVVAVGTAVEAPPGARVVDARGRHVVPGLIDALVYHDPLHELLYTSAGVTLVRDHGGELADVLEAAHPDVRERTLGPALQTAGAVLDGFPPSTGAALVLRDAHEARHRTEALLEQGVDFLSVQVNLSLAAFEEVLAVASEHAVQVWGPIPDSVPLERALAAGAAGKLRGVLFLDRLLPEGKGWSELEAGELDGVVERVAASGLAVVPMLVGTARLLTDPRAVVGGEPPELLLVGPGHAGHWRAELAAREALLADPEWIARGRASVSAQRSLVLALHRAGVPIVAGSGAPHPWLPPGQGLHRELAELSAAGLQPAELLHVATEGAARALGLPDRGRIEPGAVADLLVLGSDPREDLAALRAIEAVCLRGRVLEWSELDQRLAELEVRLADLRERLARPIEVAPPELPEGAEILRGLARSVSVAGELAAERFAMVREVDDSVTFVGRRAARAAGGEVLVSVRQRYRAGALEDFAVTLRTGAHELVVRGLRVAGQMRLERRLDGAHVGTYGVREALVAVDIASVTTPLALAQFQGEGAFPVLRFDQGLEAEVVRWELALNPDGDHVIRTPVGLELASFAENGTPRILVHQTGSGSVTTQFHELSTLGGPGPGLPEEKLALVRAARAAEAAAPASPPEEPGD